MAQSNRLRKEVAAMASVERVLTALPDNGSRQRVITWTVANFPDGNLADDSTDDSAGGTVPPAS